MSEHAPPTSSSPSIQASGATDRGKKRERNEDAFLIAKLQRAMFVQETNLSDRPATWLTGATEGWLFMIADGMGGQGSGDVASRTAVWAVADYICNVTPWLAANHPARQTAGSVPGMTKQLSEAMTAGERTVREEAAKPEVSSRMGTTLTMAYLLWPHLYVAHVGDSRCYLLRAGQLSRLTTDHTMADKLAEQGFGDVDATSPWHHVLWNSLGGDENEAKPQISRVDLHPGDRLLLCTDGLTRHLDDAAILAFLAGSQGGDEICRQLIATTNEQGGSDNVTVLVADVGRSSATGGL